MTKNATHITALFASGALMISTLGVFAADKPAAPQKQPAPAQSSATAPAPEAPTFKDLPDTATAAEVNGTKIPMKEINQAVAAVKKQDPRLDDGSTEAQAALGSFQHNVLDDLIDFQLLLQEAQKRNITPNPKDIDAQIWQVRAKFTSGDAYNKWLQVTGQTEDSLRQTAQENMAVEELGSQLAVDVTVNDADLQKFYDDNKSEFVIPDSISVDHILIAVKPDATDQEKKDAKTKADKVLKEALNSKSDFGELAAKYSDDKVTSAKGGNLGYLVKVNEGSWKPVVDAAFAGTPGKVVSQLVESTFGYHIIKPIEKKPGRTVPLDEVRDDIKPVILRQKTADRISEELTKLRKTATIKTYI